ncbi:MAG: TIM barrel protein [Actinomycetota bacterium]
MSAWVDPATTVLSHFSLARQHPIDDRIRLAATNGFSSIGLYVGHYQQLLDDGEAPGRVRELLAEHGVRLAEIEVIPGLGADGAGGERAAAFEATAYAMADTFGCRYLQVIGPANLPLAEAAQAFGALCDRAADHGLVVGLEFLPFNDIATVIDARHIVETADRPNGGICVDIWHHERGLADLDAIAALPGELITGIQLNDGSKVPQNDDYYTDCLANRCAPGEGEFDVAGFLTAVRATGSTVPVSFEVCNSVYGWAHPDEHIASLGRALAALTARP